LVEADRTAEQNDDGASDEAVKELAAKLVDQVRSFDFVARFDAGQFIVVLPQTGRAGAVEVAERIRPAVESHGFPGPRPGAGPVGIGVSALPQDGAEPDSLVAIAGRSLAGAQAQGGNRIGSRLDRAA